MRNRFDMQLQLLDEQLTHMGELCEIAIAKATKALEECNLEQAKAIMEADEEKTVPEASFAAAACGKGSAQNFSGAEDDYGYGADR